MDSGTGTERAREFADALGRLQRDGGTLLVVGATPGDTHGRACRRLLGSSEQPRVVGRTDGSCSAGSARTGSKDRLIDLAVEARNGAAACSDAGDSTGTGPTAGPGSPEAGTARRTVAETPAAFGARVADAVAELTTDADDPRVCVDSLLPVVEELGPERTFEWYHTVSADVRAAGGVCHAHLPLARDDDLVRRFETLVDATIELRLVDGRPEQRWFVHGEVTSDWLPLRE